MTIIDSDTAIKIAERHEYLQRLKDEGEVINNYCVEYELEDPIQENMFNLDFNQRELSWIFDNDPVTSQLYGSISRRIYGGGHIIIFIFGKTNSGKSEVGQALALSYQSEFKNLKEKDIDIQLVFDDTEVQELIPKLEIGDIIFRDESGQATGRGSRNLDVHVDNVLRIFRKHQNSCIFVNPFIIKHPMIDYYIYVLGKNKNKRVTRGILYYQYQDPISLKRVITPIGRIYIPLHGDKEFRAYYDKRKDRNIKKVMNLGGTIKDRKNVEKIKRDARILVGQCRKFGKDTKKSMELLKLNYNQQFDPLTEGDKLIGGDDHYDELLYEQTKLYLEYPDQIKIDAGEKTKEEVEQEEELITQLEDYVFPYTEKDILKLAKKNNRFQKAERNFEIYHLITRRKRPLLQTDILKLYSELNTDASITRIKNRVQNLLNQIKGRLHEKEYMKHLRSIYEKNPNNKVILDGEKGNPDIYVILEETQELHVFSLKNLKLEESIGSYPIQEIEPELRFAHKKRFEYKKVRVFVSLVNNNTHTFHLYEIKNFSRTKPLNLH
jgi:hypothetical protein